MSESNEVSRLDALRRLDLLDTAPNEAYDRITRMAGQIFRLPIAAVSLTDCDRQWFKSRVGIDFNTIPRERAPCAEVACKAATLILPDLMEDPFYCDSLLARKGVRFYAGAPLVTREGYGLGAMCVLGTEPRRVEDAELRSLNDLADMVMAQIELRHAFGRVDPLSLLPNRTQMLEDLEDLAREQPDLQPRLAGLVELTSPEQLGEIVRVMGPGCVDDIITAATRTIRASLGKTGTAYHVGGTQFALLAPPGTEQHAYVQTLQAMLADIRRATASRFMTTPVAGVAGFVLPHVKPADVLRTAHSAVLDARGSLSKVSIYSPTRDAVHHRRFAILNAFGAALESSDQLRLVYQPRIDLATGACVGAEALLRWTHPELGPIPPGEFIPLVERTSMARATTAWVLDAALMQLARWRDIGLALELSVNVSTTNLVEQDFADRVASSLERCAIHAPSLELEVTESAIMEDAGYALEVLEAVAANGTRLAIDDFGTGYSSLSYLQRLPAHVVKIDQSFVRGGNNDQRQRSLVSTMTTLAHDLGYRVVAEGVEDRASLDMVRAAGCNEGQGYLFSRPMEAAAMSDWHGGWVGPYTTPIEPWVPTPGVVRSDTTRTAPQGAARKPGQAAAKAEPAVAAAAPR